MSETATSEKRSTQMRTDKFRVAYDAMKGIASKTLPIESEVKLALLVKSYEKMYDATTAVLKKIEQAYGREIGSRTILNAAGIARRDRFAATLITVKLPPVGKLIVRADLPKKSDDDTDATNRQATAFLVSQLGPFYNHEATGADKELLDTELDADSLAALEATLEGEDAPVNRVAPFTADVITMPAAAESNGGAT